MKNILKTIGNLILTVKLIVGVCVKFKEIENTPRVRFDD